MISKILSGNDVGLTGGHQAGMLVPKRSEVLRFFPRLDPAQRNPRCRVEVYSDDLSDRWNFNFIHYNNKLHWIWYTKRVSFNRNDSVS